ncbi:predicted protein [Naegleria gruberi]|uniref:Predicted protein n=1 Tax=Naegleria gruberi TaxID=5762 RepID=D2VCZ0_NAEGR|nr:uncharacterized protein NAEGRDRAFT_66737 [Naegleria gruberi]EFC45506.1 predicted protein [Naegleria gruberi]|eukprot:XP_002678250.1 predicted protein [Naegleria gruberi strain NEG-M]
MIQSSSEASLTKSDNGSEVKALKYNEKYEPESSRPISDSNGQLVSYELEVMMMNTSVLLGYAHIHLPVILLSVQQPNDAFVVFEDEKMKRWRENWNSWFLRLPRSRNAILHELNFSFNKAHRFWVGLQKGQYITEKEKKDALKKVKKNLAHGIRFCKYGYQIAFGGCIYDYLETNALYDEVVYGTDNYTTWEEYESLVKTLYDKWMVEYKEDIKAVMRECRKECLSMERESNLIVSDILNKFVTTFSKESTFKRRDYENITLSFGPFSLNRVFGISVTPIFIEGDNVSNPNDCNLFKLDIDFVFQEAENSLSFREMDLYLECNGSIIEAISNENETHYSPLCVPRFLSEEYHNLDKRHGNGFTTKLKLSDYAILENPSGTRVNLYYYRNEWRFSFGNESQKWQNEWILDRDFVNEISEPFLKLWEKLDMKKPTEQNSNFTFFFTYQPQSGRIIYCGCRNLSTMKEEIVWRDLGEQYNWKDQVKQLFFDSIEDIKEAVNDFNQFPPMFFEGFECINFTNNYRSFQIKSDLRSSIPHLRITNTNYVDSLLDEEVISNPPPDLIESKHNYDTLICLIVRSKFSETDKGDEKVVSELNRIFLKSYVNLKYPYMSLVREIKPLSIRKEPSFSLEEG